MINDITNWTAEKTVLFNIDGVPVAIKTLPAELQFDILTYDKMRQDYLNLMYQREKLHFALRGKLADIQEKIKVQMTKTQPSKETSNDTEDAGKE